MSEETIAAVSTARGRAGVAVVRVSGPASRAVAEALGFPGLEPRRARVGTIRHPETGRAVDRGVAILFTAPASYTGEDVVEFGCHGGHLAPRLVLDAAFAAGARPAEPGEFTRRAFLNGKLDLVQAEATLDLVEAGTEAMGRAALRQLEGALSRRAARIRERLLRLQALLSYEIDFPEEDEGPVTEERLEAATASLCGELDDLLRNAPEGELLREGALTVVAGLPNAGKSSLFNMLLGSDRAIVTEIPGTTRDAIEALVSVAGFPFRLVDTAGLREDAERVERLGIEVARGYLERADLVLLCAEMGRELLPPERRLLDECERVGSRPVVVRTKADLRGEGDVGGERPGGRSEGDAPPVAVTSAVTGAGFDHLRALLVEAVYRGVTTAGEAPFLVRRRQVRAVRTARAALEEFREARSARAPPEIAAVHLRDAATALERLLGIVDHEEVLDVLFSSFCVGK